MSSRSAEYFNLQAMFSNEHLLELSDDGGETVFPNGSAMAICTNCATRVIEVVGRGEVWGYASEDNPGTEAAAGQDGHDFAVIDHRYIADVWLRFFACITRQAVFDLCSESDAAQIRRLYGDQQDWERIPDPNS